MQLMLSDQVANRNLRFKHNDLTFETFDILSYIFKYFYLHSFIVYNHCDVTSTNKNNFGDFLSIISFKLSETKLKINFF